MLPLLFQRYTTVLKLCTRSDHDNGMQTVVAGDVAAYTQCTRNKAKDERHKHRAV